MQRFEDVLHEAGGMGMFQVLVTVCVVSCQITVGWSMLQMAYAGMSTDYTCLHGNLSHDPRIQGYQDPVTRFDELMHRIY